MASKDISEGLAALFQAHPPKDNLQAIEYMALLGGCSMGLGKQIDIGSGHIMATAADTTYSEYRRVFQAAAIYLAATAVPELSHTGMNMRGAIDSLTPLIVEKIYFTGNDGNTKAMNDLSIEALDSLLRAVSAVFIYAVYQRDYPELTNEQLEAKSQEIHKDLLAVFKKLLNEGKQNDGNE